MKPIKLTMEAFGPYVEKETIDFSILKANTMFLIHGPTGAGKTTILDAMCYALYGETSSGNIRNAINMISQFNNENSKARVEFEFELRGDKFKVERVIKEGGAAKAVIHKYDGEEYKVLESKIREVTKRVTELIGFDCGQFRQVILIPQGEFRKLLNSNVEDKQKILEKMFGTRKYRIISDIAKERAIAVEEEIKEFEQKKNWILNALECQNIEAVKGVIQEKEKTNEKISNDFRNKDLEFKTLQDKLNIAKINNLRIEELETATKKLKELEGKKENAEKTEKLLEKAKKAMKIFTFEDRKNRCETEKNSLINEGKAKSRKRDEAQNALKKSEDFLNQCKSKNKDRDDLNKEIVFINNNIESLKKLDNEKVKFNNIEKEYSISESEKKNIEEEKNNINKRTEEVSIEIGAMASISTELIEKKNKLKELKEVLQKRKELNKVKKEYQEIIKRCESVQLDYDKATRAYEKTKENVEHLNTLWNKGQAGILAENLSDGIPCPVCGSIHHLSLALKEKDVPTEERIKEEKKLLETCEFSKEKCNKALNQVEIDKEKLKDIIKRLNDELQENLEITEEDLIRLIEEQEKQAINLQKRLMELQVLEKDLEKIKVREKELAVFLNKKIEESKVLGEAYGKQKGILEEIEKSVPEEMRSLNLLEDKKKKIEQQLNNMQKELEKAENNYKIIANTASSLESEVKKLQEMYLRKNEEYKENLTEYEKQLKLEGFTSEDDYKASKLNEEKIIEYESGIKLYGEMMKSAKDKYERAKEDVEKNLGSIRELKIIDLKELEKSLKKIATERDDLITLLGNVTRDIESLKKNENQLLKIEEAMKEKEEKYRVVKYIGNMLNGKNSFKIDFERFVLVSLLEEVNAMANQRLKIMSSGRYELLTRTEQQDGRKNGGLDLDVLDNYTGERRHVSTLSGGESFLASLSYALGLADIVQAHSGGIGLDTIFIDEGFGTLDPESLDFAIKTLMELQKNGRLVGIISHVPELKERIDARLEIIKTESGSRTKFHVV